MDRESIIRQGEAAAMLLKSDEYKIAMQAVTLQSFRSFRDSKPEATAEREYHYNLQQAVRELTNTLQAMVDNAKVEEFNATREAKQEKKESENGQESNKED